MYRSLSEVQIEREDDIARHPVSRPEAEVPQTPAELLYQVRKQTGLYTKIAPYSCTYKI